MDIYLIKTCISLKQTHRMIIGIIINKLFNHKCQQSIEKEGWYMLPDIRIKHTVSLGRYSASKFSI